MNTHNNKPFTATGAYETKKISSLSNETLALGYHEKKAFTAADLWNIQRQKRVIVPRRYFV